MAGTDNAQEALRKIKRGLQQAALFLPVLERAGLEPKVRHHVDIKRLARDTITQAQEAGTPPPRVSHIEVQTFFASCVPSESIALDDAAGYLNVRPLNEVSWRDLFEMQLAALECALPPAVHAKHGASERQVRFIRALSMSMRGRFDKDNIALITWICAALGCRPSEDQEYTADHIRKILRTG